MRRRPTVTIALRAAVIRLALSGALLVACSPPVAIETTLVPAIERVYEGTASTAVPLVDGRVLVSADDGLFVVGAPGTTPERVGEPDELGAIVAWTAIDGATLIAGEEAVVLVRGTSLVAAPIAEVLGEGETLHALAATPREGAISDLWISTSVGLYLFRDEALSPIAIEGYDLARAELAAAGEDELWVVAEGRAFRVTVDDGEARATVLAQPLDVVSIASDDRGVPWMIAALGLHVLEDDGQLLRFRIPGRPSEVRASGSGPDVWVTTDDGAWHVSRRSARAVSGMPESGVVLPGTDGEAFVIDGGAVDRVRARRRVALEGLHEGARLVDRTEVHLVVDQPETATVITTIDRRAIELEGSSIIVLDPATLAIGPHRLEVTVRRDDGTLPATISRTFTIAPSVTWNEEVRGIYVEHCSDCHGPAGPSPTRLDSREAFEANIDRILENTRLGRMPLGRAPLTPEVIGLIETWSETGFSE